MKKHALKILSLALLSLTLSLLSSGVVIAQSSQIYSEQKSQTATEQKASSQTANASSDSSVEMTREQAVAQLIVETKACRELLAAYKTREATLVTELALADENGASLTRSYTAAKTELAALRSSISQLELALRLSDQALTKLEVENKRLGKKVKKLTVEKYLLTAANIAQILLRFL